MRIKDLMQMDEHGHRAGHREGPPGTLTTKPKYKVPDEHLETVLDACRRGVPQVNIARALGINYRTWMRVREEDERVAEVLTEALGIEEEELTSILLEKARAGETAPLIFALKGRHGWRDHGTPGGSKGPRVNVTINLPAAQATVEDYVRTIEGTAEVVEDAEVLEGPEGSEGSDHVDEAEPEGAVDDGSRRSPVESQDAPRDEGDADLDEAFERAMR